MSKHKIIEGLKQAIAGEVARVTHYIGCGSCKRTGWMHIWNSVGDLVPVDPPQVCLRCKGSGLIACGEAEG